jgi:hypothetical protein
MTNHRLAVLSLFLCLAACAAEAPAQPPIDPPHAVPIDPSGRFAVTSSFALASPPAAAADVLGELLAATDGPDDPSRCLIDLMIAKLPDGPARAYATVVAPYLAAYVNQRIATVAPKLVDGARGLATGLSRIAHRFGTTEVFDIAGAADFDGHASAVQRTIIGFRFDLHAGRDVADVRFAPLGMPDLAATTNVVVERDDVVFDRHTVAVPYTQLLRLGFDAAVVPDIVPGAHDLAQALDALVDCDRLGTEVSDWMGLGSPSFYATACGLGLSSLATRIYDRIAAIDAASLPLELSGQAWAIDDTGDGPMDAIARGTWTGSLAGIAVTSSFEGSRR